MSVRPLTVVILRDFFRGFFQQWISPITTKPRSSVVKVIPYIAIASNYNSNFITDARDHKSQTWARALFSLSHSVAAAHKARSRSTWTPMATTTGTREFGFHEIGCPIWAPLQKFWVFFWFLFWRGPNSDFSFFVANFRHFRKIFSKENLSKILFFEKIKIK